MKKCRFPSLLAAVILLAALFLPMSAAAVEDPGLTCRNAILIDATYDEVLYDKGAYDKVYPASITKVMTALLVLEAVDAGQLTLDTPITATAEALEVPEGSSTAKIQVGDTYTFGTGEFTVLAPSGINPDDSNNNSVVIKLTNGANSFLLTGDAEETSEQDMISTGRDLDCDVLCLGHHGSASSTSWDLLEAASPECAVVSCGTDNSYGHPAAETMQKLQDMEIPVYRTDKQGTVIALSDGETLTWNLSPCNDYSCGDQQSAQASDSAAFETAEMVPQQQTGALVWIPATGKKYHSIPDCGNMNPDKATQLTEAEAIQRGYGKCSKCF